MLILDGKEFGSIDNMIVILYIINDFLIFGYVIYYIFYNGKIV